MRKLNQSDLLYNTSYEDDRCISIDMLEIVTGSFKTFVFNDTIVNIRDNTFFDDVEISYKHDAGSTLIAEHTFAPPSAVHHVDNKKIDITQGGNNIYSGSGLTDAKSKTTFFKGERCLAMTVIPTSSYLDNLIEKDYSFSSKLYDEINGKNDNNVNQLEGFHNPELSMLIKKIIDAVNKGGIWEEMIELWSKEYYLLLLEQSQEPQNKIQKAQYIIETNLKERPNAEAIARELGISKRTLSSLFQAQGTTFSQYRRSIIINKASKLLLQGVPQVEVARQLGYKSYQHFMKIIDDSEVLF